MKKSLVQKMIQKYGERVRFFRLTDDDDFYRLKDMSDYEKEEILRLSPNSKLAEYIRQERIDKMNEKDEDEERKWEEKYIHVGCSSKFDEKAERERIRKWYDDMITGKWKSDWDD